MRMKFHGKRIKHYQGIDGLGGMLDLRPGQECDVSESVGGKLKKHYYADFEQIADKEHAPEANKMMGKGSKFKSK